MIVSLGESLIDLIHGSDTAEPEARLGGSPYNVSIALARLGTPAGFVCPLSTDVYGQRLSKGLEENGVRRCVGQFVDAPTAIAEVFTNQDGHPHYVFHRDHTADRALSEHPPIQSLPSDIHALHFGSLVLAQEADWPAWRDAIVEAKGRGAYVAFDPNVRVSLIDDFDRYRERVEEAVELADLIKTSDEDLELLSPGCAPEQQIQDWHTPNRTLILTEGSKGAQAWTGPGYHATCRDIGTAEIVDTVGAGDTFQAALLAWMWHRNAFQLPLDSDHAHALLQFATKAAVLNCTRKGCQPPTLREIED